MTRPSTRLVQRIALAVCVVFVGFALGSCGKQSGGAAALRNSRNQDPEATLENRIQALLGQINTTQTEVNKLIRASGPELTQETRNKGTAARHKSYLPEEYVSTLREGQAALKSKFDTFAAGHPAFESLRNTNGPVTNLTIGHSTNAAPNELTEEMNLKVRLIEVKTLEEEMVIQGQNVENAATENQPPPGTARAEPYSQEDYLMTLRLLVDILERKVTGLEAEATFYRNLLGLDPDDIPLPIQKK